MRGTEGVTHRHGIFLPGPKPVTIDLIRQCVAERSLHCNHTNARQRGASTSRRTVAPRTPTSRYNTWQGTHPRDGRDVGHKRLRIPACTPHDDCTLRLGNGRLDVKVRPDKCQCVRERNPSSRPDVPVPDSLEEKHATVARVFLLRHCALQVWEALVVDSERRSFRRTLQHAGCVLVGKVPVPQCGRATSGQATSTLQRQRVSRQRGSWAVNVVQLANSRQPRTCESDWSPPPSNGS